MKRWASKSQFGALTSCEGGTHEWAFPLRDDTGVNYQINVHGRWSCLFSRICASEYGSEGEGRVVSRQRSFTSPLWNLAGGLDHALSLVHGWMAERGAVKLQMNMRPVVDYSKNLRRKLAEGKTLDEALTELRAAGASIFDCIASVRSFRHCELAEAKQVVEGSPASSDLRDATETFVRELSKTDDKDVA